MVFFFMFKKNYILFAIFLSMYSDIQGCFKATAYKRLHCEIGAAFSDKKIRILEQWLISIAPKQLTCKNCKHHTAIELNWSDLVRHILMPEIKIPKKGKDKENYGRVAGLHHDYQGTLEKHKFIKTLNVIEDNDTYHCDYSVDGKKKMSSFFPQEWDPKKIFQEIVQAVNTGTVRPNTLGHEIIGYSSTGFKIAVYVDRHGTVKTAYPIKTDDNPSTAPGL